MKYIDTKRLKNAAFAMTVLTLSTFSIEAVQAEETTVESQPKINQIKSAETSVTSNKNQGADTTLAVQEESFEVASAETSDTIQEPASDTNEKAAEEVQEESAKEAKDGSPVFDNDFTYKELKEAGQLYVDEATPTEGRWASGEIHAHTNVSGDASEPYMAYENVTNAAFREDIEEIPDEGQPNLNQGEAFDYFMTADHLRNSPRDVNGNEVETAAWEKIWQQVEKFNALKEEGKYDGKIYYPGFEWDMFGLDHASVAIIEEGTNRVPIDGIHEFEWLYAYDTSDDMFYSNEEEIYGPRQNEKSDKENSFRALQWLQENYPKSILIANHPSRHAGDDSGEVLVEDLRRMQDTAPDVVIGFEGMPGNQMGGDRGEMTDIYGGTDVMVAEVGGVWDSLLGEGRHFFNLTNSDFHFKVSSNRLYSSGYWPSEYSRNYTWVEGNTFEDMADGLRSGNSFSVFGDLITALDFKIIQDGKEGVMGSDFEAVEGEEATLVIRFRESDLNNYRPITPHDSNVTNDPSVDHIDLISGLITGPVSDPTIDKNPTTKVVARFDKEDWGEADEDGFYTVTYDFTVDTDRYFRLRGTNLGLNVPGETDENGNPLLDVELDVSREDYDTDAAYMAALENYFNEINNRNYRDLWFYSNPIFIYAEEDETLNALEEHVAQLEETVVDLRKENADQDDKIASLKDQLKKVEKSLAKSEKATNALASRVEELEDEIEALSKKATADDQKEHEYKDDDKNESDSNNKDNAVTSDHDHTEYNNSESDDIGPEKSADKVSDKKAKAINKLDSEETKVNSASALPQTGSAATGINGIIGLLFSGLGLSFFKRKND